MRLNPAQQPQAYANSPDCPIAPVLAELPEAPEVPKELTEGISAIREYRKGFKQHWNDGVIFVFGTIAASPGRGRSDAFSF